MPTMVIGENDGFKIEDKLLNLINERAFKDIDPIIQEQLISISSNISIGDYFQTSKKTRKGLEKKTDLFVLKNSEKFCNLSIKSGTGNSVHQESIYEFVKFLHSKGSTCKETNPLLFFHWGDTSLDGLTGEKDITKRMSGEIIKKKYPDIISQLNKLFKKYKTDIIKRVLIGSEDGMEPTHILYATNLNLNEIYISSIQKILKFHEDINLVSEKYVLVGNMTFQNQHRCLQGQEKLKGKEKKKRTDIQFKWNLYKDIKGLNEK